MARLLLVFDADIFTERSAVFRDLSALSYSFRSLANAALPAFVSFCAVFTSCFLDLLYFSASRLYVWMYRWVSRLTVMVICPLRYSMIVRCNKDVRKRVRGFFPINRIFFSSLLLQFSRKRPWTSSGPKQPKADFRLRFSRGRLTGRIAEIDALLQQHT